MPAGEMMRLKKALEQRAKAIDIERTLHTPKNTEAITILKRPQHLARVGGGGCMTSWWAALCIRHEASAPQGFVVMRVHELLWRSGLLHLYSCCRWCGTKSCMYTGG